MTLRVTSSAFGHGERIPSKYTADGADVSPPLRWEGAPGNTQSFALICDDPDAPMGTWVHWVVYDLPASATELPEAVPAGKDIPGGGRQGRNSWGKTAYGGPSPPSGEHRYFFRVYALDTMLNLPPGKTKEELLRAMEGHVLAQGELMGRYRRP